jgi:hypothetical protein
MHVKGAATWLLLPNRAFHGLGLQGWGLNHRRCPLSGPTAPYPDGHCHADAVTGLLSLPCICGGAEGQGYKIPVAFQLQACRHYLFGFVCDF